MVKEAGRPSLVQYLFVTIPLSLWALPITVFPLLGTFLFWAMGSLTYTGIYTHRRLPYAWALSFDVKPKTWPDWYMANKMGMVKTGGAYGGALGNVIAFRPHVIPPGRSDAIHLHELRHAWQTMVFGIFQQILYGCWNLIQGIRLGRAAAYITNPFEKDAYIFSGEQELWTKRLNQYLK